MIKLYLFNECRRAAAYGIGTYIREMITCLSHLENISLNIVQLRSEKEEFAVEEKNGYIIYYFPNNKVCSNNEIEDRYYRNIWYILQQYINPAKQDTLFFHLNYNQEYALISFMKRDFPKCHVIFTVHCQDWAFLLNGNVSQFKEIVEKNKEELIDFKEKKVYESYEKERTLYLDVNTIICLGEYAKHTLTEIYKISNDKIEVISNGITDIGENISASKKKKLRQQLFIPENEKVLLFVGRLDEIKGLDILIKAFKLVIDKYLDCHLYIIGDGDFDNYMKETEGYWRKITFTGRLNREDVYKFYQIADVGIIPSRYEPFGYVAIEMMMYDIPVIATKTSGLNEIINDKVNGYKVSVKETHNDVIISTEDIKNKIFKILKTMDQKKNISRDFFLNEYTIQKMIEKYMSLIYNIIRSGNYD